MGSERWFLAVFGGIRIEAGALPSPSGAHESSCRSRDAPRTTRKPRDKIKLDRSKTFNHAVKRELFRNPFRFAYFVYFAV